MKASVATIYLGLFLFVMGMIYLIIIHISGWTFIQPKENYSFR